MLHDYLVNPLLLHHAPATTKCVCLGHHGGREIPQDEVNRHMIAAAGQGKTVVPQKRRSLPVWPGGRRMAGPFGRRNPCEVVPGVTAALAAASYAGIPLTHRDLASAVALITGHRRSDGSGPDLNYPALASFPGTLVFYMGMTTSRQSSAALMHGGRSRTRRRPWSRATWPDQETIPCTLGTVAEVIEQRGIRPPAVIVIGAVAAGVREFLHMAPSAGPSQPGESSPAP